ncbi:hypothetical protein [Streptomyces sp. NPDC055060]
MTDLLISPVTVTSGSQTSGSTTAPVVHGTIIISAIETAWKEIRRRHPAVPDICVRWRPAEWCSGDLCIAPGHGAAIAQLSE